MDIMDKMQHIPALSATPLTHPIATRHPSREGIKRGINHPALRAPLPDGILGMCHLKQEGSLADTMAIDFLNLAFIFSHRIYYPQIRQLIRLGIQLIIHLLNIIFTVGFYSTQFYSS